MASPSDGSLDELHAATSITARTTQVLGERFREPTALPDPCQLLRRARPMLPSFANQVNRIHNDPATAMNHQIRHRLPKPSNLVVRAGAAYFAIVFAAGFALGTVRTLLHAPRIGELLAVLFELPLMLAIAWLACGTLLTHFRIPQRVAPRLSMGAVAFALLMLAELTLSVTAFDRSMSDFARELTTPHGLLGLSGQVLFALMPLVHRA